MTKYAKYNENNEIVAFYSKDIHGDNIPENTISITDSKWQEILSKGTENFRVDLSSKEIIPHIKSIITQIEEEYNIKFNNIKSKCKLVIESIYPQWKQNNLNSDFNIAKSEILTLDLTLSESDLYIDLKNLINVNTIDELKSLDIETLNYDIITSETGDVKIAIIENFKIMVNSYIGFRIIELYRVKSDELEISLNNIYNDTNLSNEEKLQNIKNFDIIY